jgi:putative RecB family exonuclease
MNPTTDNLPLIPPPHLSASSISTFQQCPLRYKYSRIDNLPEPPSVDSLRGNFVHDVLENVYREDSAVRTLSTARSIAKTIWTDYEERAHTVARSEEAIRRFKATAWYCIENLFNMEDPKELEFDGLEAEINHEVSGVRVKGFIDRWNRSGGGIVIGDYKTGKTPAPRYVDDKFFQLLLYGVVLREQLNEDIVGLELLYIKDGDCLKKTPTESDMQNVHETVVEIKKQIDARCMTGEFEYKPSRLCDWCSFKSICPYWRK